MERVRRLGATHPTLMAKTAPAHAEPVVGYVAQAAHAVLPKQTERPSEKRILFFQTAFRVSRIGTRGCVVQRKPRALPWGDTPYLDGRGRLKKTNLFRRPYALARTSNAWRSPSPIITSSSSMTVSVATAGRPIHQASRLSLPYASISPRLACDAGTPRPRKSRLVRASTAPQMRKGRKASTGVRLLGRMCRHIIAPLPAPIARAAST